MHALFWGDRLGSLTLGASYALSDGSTRATAFPEAWGGGGEVHADCTRCWQDCRSRSEWGGR